MRVLLLGATGSIGTAVLAELVSAGHEVIALARSELSAATVAAAGATPLRGDLRDMSRWIGAAAEVDTVIPLADTWADDMDAIETALVDALIEARPARVVFTGGCWLYGATGDRVASDGDAFAPRAAWDRSARNAARLLAAEGLSAAVIHPAMVYHAGGGVFERMIRAARAGAPIEIWGSPDKRWPLIHRDDLAVAYRLLTERPEATGHFNAAAEPGVWVRDIAAQIAAAFGAGAGVDVLTLEDVIRVHGVWAEGATFDQQMAGSRLADELGWAPRVTDYRASDLFSQG